jgi:hypothetical protein
VCCRCKWIGAVDYVKHIVKMSAGFILFYAVTPLPFSWWGEKDGKLFFLLPYIGYYAYG